MNLSLFVSRFLCSLFCCDANWLKTLRTSNNCWTKQLNSACPFGGPLSLSLSHTHTHFLSLSLSLSRTHTLSVVLSSFAFHKPCSCGCCFCASCTCASTHARRSSHQKDVMKWTPCWNALNTTQMQASLTHCASSRKRMRLCVNNHSCHRLARTLQQTTPLHLQSTLARTTTAVNTATAATTTTT